MGSHLREVRQLPRWGGGGGALEESLGRGVPPKCHTFVEGPVKYFSIAVKTLELDKMVVVIVFNLFYYAILRKRKTSLVYLPSQ